MLKKVLPQQNDIGVGLPTTCYQTLSYTNTYDKTYTQWICLLPAVDVVGKRKTIRFTVTCATITIVQKIVILKSILDHGRSFSCHLSGCFPSVIRRASRNYNKMLSPLVVTLFVFLFNRHCNHATLLL